ncbi:type II toxin-antitoxin system CcdA family antitoxin [Enterobacter hormaechei]|nr:type II toxin-antitoxin system CcdA family antitoxin [Enterobacter hormaechei]
MFKGIENARLLRYTSPIHASAVLTAALQEQFRAHQRAEWLAENKASIEAINQWVDENGSFSDFQRSF